MVIGEVGVVGCGVLVIGDVEVVGCDVLIVGGVPGRAPALVAGVVVVCPAVGAVPGVWVPPGIVARPVFVEGGLVVLGFNVLVIGEVPGRAPALVAGAVVVCPAAELVPVAG